MRRFMVIMALGMVSLFVCMNLSVAADEPAPLDLEKECVLIGRFLGHRFTPVLQEGSEIPDLYYPPVVEVKGFDVLNVATGEWHPLNLSKDGYFCLNLGMGRYDLRGRDSRMNPFVIRRFSVPNGMMVNLGTYRILTRTPQPGQETGWNWHSCLEGYFATSMRVEHLADEAAYGDCEDWFSECHEDAYEEFADVIVRR